MIRKGNWIFTALSRPEDAVEGSLQHAVAVAADPVETSISA